MRIIRSLDRHKIRHVMMGMMCLFAAAVPVRGQNAQDTRALRIIFFANMPEVQASATRPGLAKVASYINEVRRTSANSFVIHGGDSLSPSILSALDRGAHMIDILNAIEPDVMAVAKREFAYGEDTLIQRAEEALFPFVASNAIDQSTGLPFEAIAPAEIFDVGDIKIGLVALTSPQVVEKYATRRTVLKDPIKSATEQSAILRRAGADIVILTADYDLSCDPSLLGGGRFDLVIQVSNVPSGVVKTEGVYFLPKLSTVQTVTDIHIDLAADGDRYKISNLSATNEGLENVVGDAAVAAMIAQHIEPLSGLLETPLGVSEVELSTLRNEVRQQENAFANMLADSMRLAVHADITFINGGSIRGNTRYEANSILTRNHLQAELPFRNTLALLEVTGQQIWDALEFGIPCRLAADGCFPHVSNMVAQYSESEKSLVSVRIGGKAIDLEKKYKMATTDFIAIGGDGYSMFKDASRLSSANSGQLTREILSKYIVDAETVSPSVEGRVIITK